MKETTISSYKKIVQGDIKGWLEEEVWNLLPAAYFKDPLSSVQKMEGKVVKKSMLRWAAIHPLSNGKSIFLKRDRTKGWMALLKYLVFPSKGRKEWFVAYQLKKRKLNIPKPLGWIERIHRGLVKESYYLSEAVESGVSLTEIADLLKDEKVSAELVKTIIRMHASGLLHQDLHAGNFLWNGESFFLVDLHRARLLRSLSLNQRLWNLSHLFHSLRSIWGEKEHLRFLDRYFGGVSISSQKKKKYLMKIHSSMDRLQKRQWRSRTKRCLKESTEFSVVKKNDRIVYRRREFDLEEVIQGVEEHLRISSREPCELIKKDTKSRVSYLKRGDKDIYVKQFIYSYGGGRWSRYLLPSKGIRAWVGGNGLKVRGVSSITPLALLERRGWSGRRESFLFMEALRDGLEMDRYILSDLEKREKKRAFVKAFARWLSSLHQKGIYHQDMKACNILVQKSGDRWEFYLLDLEDTRLDVNVDEKRLMKNLLQLNTSVPKTITRTDRMRFFNEYGDFKPPLKKGKPFLRRLLQKSRERGIVYVSPHGVVKEESF
ncbi:MAG: hypothetical protein FJ130_00185 [Deltaproteobacteria bacterium]|nr:hypothetical protein [Deltaproteobacteria bacterium]